MGAGHNGGEEALHPRPQLWSTLSSRPEAQVPQPCGTPRPPPRPPVLGLCWEEASGSQRGERPSPPLSPQSEQGRLGQPQDLRCTSTTLVTRPWTWPLRFHSTLETPLTSECRESCAWGRAWPRGRRLDCLGTGQDEEKAQLLWAMQGQTDLLGEGGAEAKCC